MKQEQITSVDETTQIPEMSTSDKALLWFAEMLMPAMLSVSPEFKTSHVILAALHDVATMVALTKGFEAFSQLSTPIGLGFLVMAELARLTGVKLVEVARLPHDIDAA